MSITVGHSFQDRPTQYLTLLLCPDLRQPQIHLTMEQLQILSHNMQLQDVIKIVAFAGARSLPSLHSWPCASCKMSCSFCKSFMTLLMIRFCLFFCLCPAGTGKTTTLVKYAEQRPHLRFLYVAFNKSVANEAQRRFPSNVISKTVHSLAFADIGRR